ncbi:MAG TPA: type I-E CRISPR-associated protein Cas7/Cse4/CasC, partial [Tepidiformaceae bacterium]|nr:type I-E CRISPR-associated protein Cas7/Cse4/CasC [Tepidiformaceae bacterium]
MQLELHILQNFAPSNLNRDDLGSPKSCEFGGVPRARISSQCIKRSIREEFKGAGLIGADAQAARSKRFIENVATALKGKGRDHDEAISVAQAALALLGVKVAREQKTEYLLFLAAREVEAIVAFCDQNWEALVAEGSGKRDKKDKKDAAAVAQAKDLGKVLDGGKAADLALFGRMLADLPAAN